MHTVETCGVLVIAEAYRNVPVVQDSDMVTLGLNIYSSLCCFDGSIGLMVSVVPALM